jgi:hypothetical protein
MSTPPISADIQGGDAPESKLIMPINMLKNSIKKWRTKIHHQSSETTIKVDAYWNDPCG